MKSVVSAADCLLGVPLGGINIPESRGHQGDMRPSHVSSSFDSKGAAPSGPRD